MSPTDPCTLSATEALALFRRRQLSPVELLQAQIARAARVEPLVNAFSAMHVEQGLAAARASEQVWLCRPDEARPLEGLPTALKNEHQRAGWVVTHGSLALGDAPETADEPLVRRLLDAGAVLHAQSNVPEFCLASFTRSRRHGVTRNPWRREMTSGGSSGGSAAALACGTATLATGSDLAGSIRMPASWCGVVGFKPAYGRVPESTFLFATNTANHNGPMARTVADCALMFNVMNGPDSIDPASLSPRIEVPLRQAGVAGLRIALSVDLGLFRVDAAIERNTRAMAQALRDQGAIVDEVDVGFDHRARDAMLWHLGFHCLQPMAREIAPDDERLTDYVRAFHAVGARVTPAMVFEATDIVERMHRSLARVTDRYDALICPTMAANACRAEGVANGHDDLLDHAMTWPFNLLGRHPVLSVPSGLDDRGVPTGLQVVGRRYEDAMPFRVGAAVEAATGWARRRPEL